MIGHRIKYERITQKVSMTEISEHTGLATSCLSKIENGQSTDIKLSTLIKLRDALGFAVIDAMLKPLNAYEKSIVEKHNKYEIFSVKRRKIKQ